MTVASDVFTKLNVKRAKDWAPTALPKKIWVCEESCFVASKNILSNKESKADIIIPPDRKHHAAWRTNNDHLNNRWGQYLYPRWQVTSRKYSAFSTPQKHAVSYTSKNVYCHHGLTRGSSCARLPPQKHLIKKSPLQLQVWWVTCKYGSTHLALYHT